MNTYGYVSGNPIRGFDIYGLEQVMNGQGNISICEYYSQKSSANPSCSYYKNAYKICRGDSYLVNAAVNVNIWYSWSKGLQDSQSTILDNIRNILILEDIARREEGNIDKNGCACGNDIDRYHEFAFDFSGLNSVLYGGNLWTQGIWPNPVPYDNRNLGVPAPISP